MRATINPYNEEYLRTDELILIKPDKTGYEIKDHKVKGYEIPDYEKKNI